MEGKTSWRAYAAFDNLQVGSADYYECQVTPDGQSMALFIGGTTMMEKFGNIPMLVDFLGKWVVRDEGERAPVVAANGWRLGVVDWIRGSVYGDLGLESAPVGADYLVTVADISNWQATQTELSLASIGAVTSASSELIPVNLEDSRTVAETLGELPVEGIIAIAPGETRRVVLVFPVSHDAAQLGISLDGSAATLADDGVPGRLVMLPPNRTAPAMPSGVVANVIDGRTLLVTMADTGQNERVRLIGIAASAGDAAKEHLAAYVGQTVLLESDPAHPDDNRLQRYAWTTDSAGMPELLNDVLVENELATYEGGETAGRFDAMLATMDGLPVTAAVTPDPVVQIQDQPTDESAPAELTDADLAYLAELARYRNNLELTLQYYDMFMTAPTLDAEFYGHLGITILGWSVFYDGIVELQPTPQFADLHTRLIAAFEPFHTLAYQIEPALDQILAGQAPAQQFAGFDYDVMTNAVSAARPALEQVLAEIDAVLAAAGITTEGSVAQ